MCHFPREVAHVAKAVPARSYLAVTLLKSLAEIELPENENRSS